MASRDQQEPTRKIELAELLLDAARQLGETMEPDRVYDRFHDLLADVVPHDAVVVSSYDEGDGLIRCDYAWIEGKRLDPAIFPPVALNRSGGGMQSRVIVGGQPIVFNDVTERVRGGGTFYDVDSSGNVRKIPDEGPSGTQAVMMVPVKNEGRVVGVVQLMSDERTFESGELDVLEGLVAQMAAAVRNARLQRERARLMAAEAAARAVAAERERAARVLDLVGDGIFLVDGDGIVRFWNRAAEVATGVVAPDVVERRLGDVVRGWDELSTRVPVSETGASARSVTLPLEVQGRDAWLSFVAVAGPEGIVYAFRDVTDERRLDEEKSDFIATISHELRTPMAAVYGAAETLLRRAVDLEEAQARQLLEMIASQAARLSHITEEVLLASRLDRGELPLGRGRVEIARLVRRAVEVTCSDAEAPQLDVAVPEGLAVSGDGDRIQQVLVNLLDNAVKYGGGAPVEVRAEGIDGVVRIAVSDSGPGIPAGDRDRIFEKFYRGDPNLTRSPGGTGLGLYIARELVRRMGGRLDLEARDGAGARFVVELPAAS